jgi:hypothetical protein
MTLDGIIEGTISGLLVAAIWEFLSNRDFRNKLLHEKTLLALLSLLGTVGKYWFIGVAALMITLLPIFVLESLIGLFIQDFKILPNGFVINFLVGTFGLSDSVASLLIMLSIVIIGRITYKWLNDSESKEPSTK